MAHDELIPILEELIPAADEAANLKPLSIYTHEDARRTVLKLVGAARMIATTVQHGPPPDDFDPDDRGLWDFARIRDSAIRLKGALELQSTLDASLRKFGPVISVEVLHSWVWTPAASLWRDGHHRNAIHAAAAQIDAQLQAKLGREDISGVALLREAFSLKPPEPGKARLRFSWLTAGSEAFKSRHEGALAFGAGCFQLIRNSAAHQPTPLEEHVAIEHLACLSLLARLIKTATVVRADAAPPRPGTSRPFG